MINLKVDKFTDVASQKYPTSFLLIVDGESYSYEYYADTEKPFNVWRWSGPPYSIDIKDESLAEKVKASEFCGIGAEIRRIDFRTHRFFQHPLYSS